MIAATSLASFHVLVAGARIQRFLGESRVRILAGLMGQVLAAMPIPFMLNGINDARPGLPKATDRIYKS